jgi:hypothetical protein
VDFHPEFIECFPQALDICLISFFSFPHARVGPMLETVSPFLSDVGITWFIDIEIESRTSFSHRSVIGEQPIDFKLLLDDLNLRIAAESNSSIGT